MQEDQILQFLRVTGPVLPAKVAKNLKTEILFASALLSDLVSRSKVKISHLKVGGSPLYYLPGQEGQLYPFAAGNMNPKDQQVLERLKTDKVLRENELDLLSKVALRSLKDFAIPLHVRVGDKNELFWKWRMLSSEETTEKIKDYLDVPVKKEVVEAAVETAQEKPEQVAVPPVEKTEEKPETKQEEPAEEVKEETSTRSEASEDSEKAELSPKLAPAKEETEPTSDLEEKKEEVKEEPKEEVKEKEVPSEVKEKVDEESKETNGKQTKLTETKEKKSLAKKIKEKVIRKKRISVPDTFLPQITDLFNRLNIKIELQEVIRKNAEVDFHVKIPSVVGEMHYFCKAKKKNKCDEKDISAAYLQAQMKKLPLLFLHSDQISKKAIEMLESGALENVIVKRVE